MNRKPVVATALLLLLAVTGAHAAGTTSCDGPVYRQFDFWAGDWDVFEHDAQDKPPVARAHVDLMLGDCVLREDYAQDDGMHGRSFTIYDARRKLWHQSWVNNRGELLVIEGHLQGRRILLEGEQATADGKRRIRATWEPQGDTVREIAMASDDGKTWSTLFDIVFRRHRH